MLNSKKMAFRAGLEPATHGLEIRCSIQLSYRNALEGHKLQDMDTKVK